MIGWIEDKQMEIAERCAECKHYDEHFDTDEPCTKCVAYLMQQFELDRFEAKECV